MNEQALPTIDSRATFQAAVSWGFARAIGAGDRRIVCVDRDFVHWPLDEAALHAQWTAWLRQSGRQLVLLAARFDEVPRRHPRFVAWRRNFAHAVMPLEAPPDVASRLPSLLLGAGGTMVRLIDDVHWRGRTSIEESESLPWREEIESVLERSEPAFPANPLGL